MKYFFLLYLAFACVFVAAQNPIIVKNMSAANLTPNQQNQTDWVNNEWNGLFFFSTSPSSILKLCVTDGTNAGTVSLADLTGSTIKVIIPAQDFVYVITNVASFSPSFSSIDYIWKSDGTASGTLLVKTMPAVTSFSTTNAWTSDRDVKRNFSVIGNTMFFGAYDAINGLELWKTDGSTLGTVLVKDIKAGAGSSNPYAFCKIGGEVFFTCTQTGLERKLWKTDGTDAGTVQIPVAEPFFILDNVVGMVNNKMIFYAHNTVDGYEPYVSDGTAAGTFMLANINPSGNSWITQSQNAHLRFNSKYCFFIATNGAANAIWRTDGTSAGTIQLTSNAQAAFSGVSGGSYTDVDETGFWMIEYNSIGSGNNEKLYRSDGTIAGTYLAAQNLSYAQNVKIYKNALWMASRNTGSPANTEPWRSGGNAATTNKAFEIEPSNSGSPTFTPLSSNPYGFFVKNNKLYFFASTTIPSALNLYQYTGDFTFNGSQAGGRWRDSANWNGMMPPGITDTVFANSGTPNALNINGANAYAGVLNIGNNANINFTNATDSLIVNTKLNAGTNTNFTGNGVLTLKSITNDTVQIANGFTANNMAIQSNTNLANGTAVINNNINLTSGKLFLNNNNIQLTGNTSTVTTTSNAYVATNGTGSLQIQNIGSGARIGAVNFPIGTATNYAPVIFTNSGDADNFNARVASTISQNYTGENPAGQQYVTGAVNNTWFINEGAGGGSNASIELQWDAVQELPLFDRTQSYLGHYTGGSWSLGTQGSATGSNPYGFSRSNITSFSPFGVLNNNAVLPLQFISFSAQKCNNNQVCLNWKTANEQNVSHFEIERSVDGISFAKMGTKAAHNLAQNTYTATDDISTIQAKQLYYRIKQVDINGKTTNSTVQLIKLQHSEQITIYPNPVVDEINMANWNKVKQAQLVDVTGKIVKQWQAITSSALNISEIIPGIYFIKMKLKNEETQIQKILKQ